jgi:hypothetical protein
MMARTTENGDLKAAEGVRFRIAGGTGGCGVLSWYDILHPSLCNVPSCDSTTYDFLSGRFPPFPAGNGLSVSTMSAGVENLSAVNRQTGHPSGKGCAVGA